MLKILGLYVKGLQSYRSSNFENDLTPDALESGQIALANILGGMAEMADFFLWTPNLTASNFNALWPTEPNFLALKDLYLFYVVSKVQETSMIIRMGFSISKWPHFHRAY